MGGRYLVSGTQLGMLIALSGLGKTTEINKLVNEITEKQFVCSSSSSIEKDIDEIQTHFFKIK